MSLSAGASVENTPFQKTLVTRNEERLEHWILDEELTMLDINRRDFVVDVFWAAIGAAIGSAVPMAQELEKLYSGVGFSFVSLLLCVLFFVAVAIIILTGVIWKKRSKTSTNLVDDIRSRPKVEMS